MKAFYVIILTFFFFLNFRSTSEKVPSMPPYEGLKSFVNWIKQQKVRHWSKNVILLSHGSTDHLMLLNNLAGYNLLDEFSEVVSGFGNTLPILHKSLIKVTE